ncbi:hypothetical protein ASPCAL10496 [Aspergillus calidoustus]|uniref:C2H2-type domain-containing protein n=1 Tax=Aspergillus calidoustus TaxID=454130 RepID=A0A0U5GAA6_ASPCI|nr:hypothetical protein ASPCAL10496 [Aspergillus calidoustus]
MQPTKRPRTSMSSQVEGPFNCQLCEKSFSRIENLTRHAENHKPSARFSCAVCAKRFTRSDILKRHMKLHGTNQDQQPRPSSGATSPTAPHLLTEIARSQSHHTPDNDALEGDSRVQAPWPDQHAPRISQDNFGTAPSAVYDSPLSHPSSYPSLSEGHYGVYGEGTFDADLAWILDMPPPDLMSAPAPAPEYPSHINPASIHAIVTELPGNEASLDEAQRSSIEDRNNWPDVDGGLEPTTSREMPAVSIPDADAWVDHGEISSLSDLPGDRRGHRCAVDDRLRARLIAALEKESSVKDGLLAPDQTRFPTPAILEHFLRLFFEHVHVRFPVIHQPTFSIETAPPFLLLAMMLLGSSHSVTNRGKFVAVYLYPVATMFSRIQALDTRFLRETDNILTLLFLCVSAAWCGHKFAFEFAEGARGILVTACRRCRLLDCRQRPPSDVGSSRSMRAKLHHAWQAWIKAEQRKRLGLCINLFDLQFPALFHNQPYISKSECVNLVLPCHESFWEAKSAPAWKVLLGPAETPPATYFMVPLDTCLLYPAIKREPPYAPIDSFGKTILIYALFTHIFEWRQAVNIVLHPAFIRGPEGTRPGEGLMERQQWLHDGLDAWLTTYHQNGTSAPDEALLLHFLAQIHLYISVSDLHLFAGRSGLSEDIKLAEDSLRRWCRSPESASTMQNVYKMLDLAFQIIDRGDDHQCGFEISVALFTGGLMCWMYAKLGGQVPVGFQINLASDALEKLSCWGICSNFAQILKRFGE